MAGSTLLVMGSLKSSLQSKIKRKCFSDCNRDLNLMNPLPTKQMQYKHWLNSKVIMKFIQNKYAGNSQIFYKTYINITDISTAYS